MSHSLKKAVLFLFILFILFKIHVNPGFVVWEHLNIFLFCLFEPPPPAQKWTQVVIQRLVMAAASKNKSALSKPSLWPTSDPAGRQVRSFLTSVCVSEGDEWRYGLNVLAVGVTLVHHPRYRNVRLRFCPVSSDTVCTVPSSEKKTGSADVSQLFKSPQWNTGSSDELRNAMPSAASVLLWFVTNWHPKEDRQDLDSHVYFCPFSLSMSTNERLLHALSIVLHRWAQPQ